MKKVYTAGRAQASRKQALRLIDQTAQLLGQSVQKLCAQLRNGVESVGAQLGLVLAQGLMQQEVADRLGRWGEQCSYRHGRQPGYIYWDGRKKSLMRPRLRQKDGAELALESYQALQQNSAQGQAVARLLLRRCSTRDYAGALDSFVQGYGIKKSSVSRVWQAASQKQLAELCERSVPKDLVTMILDGKHHGDQCVIVGVGIDSAGTKHILGLWQGATENATVVKALLADLVERGLDCSLPLLIILDGSKALRKAVGEMFGEGVLVQRCRVHKLRNVLEHLPKSKQSQGAFRLRAAWALEDYEQAASELRNVGAWLETINPSACRSLEEGMHETLTLQRLGVNAQLSGSLASTNIIESAFGCGGRVWARVRRWRKGSMVLRWSAAGLLMAEKGFRRIRGYQHLPRLVEALAKLNLANQQKAA